MRFRSAALLASILFSFAADSLPAQAPAAKTTKITWKKTVLDKVFRSEGVAVADVNKDGKMDIIHGEAWYEAPDWKMHPIRKLGDYGKGDGPYSHSFACWAEDLNHDGYPDLIVIDFPGTPCYWLENPKGKASTEDGKPLHWKKHVIW